MHYLRSALLVFLVAALFSAVFAAPQSGKSPADKDKNPFYKIKVLEPKANQAYKRGDPIVVKVDTEAPEGPQIIQLHAELIFTDDLSPRPSQDLIYGFFGAKDIDGKPHSFTVLTDGDLGINDYTLRLIEMTNNGVADSTLYTTHDIPITVNPN